MLVVLLLAPLLAFASLPIALRFVVPDMLAARGLPASVGWGYFDPWNLELVLSDFRVGPPSGPSVNFAQFRAELVRDALAEGRIELTNLRLRGASFDIHDLSEARLSDSGDGVPFEQVQFNALRLAGLSEKLGREVMVRHARLVRDGDEGDRRLRLEVSVDAGGTPVEIRGTLRGDGDTQTFEGTLTATRLPARLLDPASAGMTSDWSGSVHAVTDFELRIESRSGHASLRATGSLHTAGATGNLGELSLEGVDSVWEGILTLSGPAFELPERVYFQGTLDATAAQVANSDGSSRVRMSGLHWEGVGGWHGVPVAAGEGYVDSIEFAGEAAGFGPLRAELDRVRLGATLDDAGRLQVEHLKVRDLRAETAPRGGNIRIQRLEARALRAAAGGIRVEHLVAATLEGSAGGEEGAAIWAAEHPVLEEVTIVSGAEALAASATLDSLGIRHPNFDLSALGARIEGLRLGPGGRLEIGLASLDIVEHIDQEGAELRARNFRGESLAVDGDGAWEVARLRAERIAGMRDQGENWIVHGLEAGGLRIRSGDREAGETALDNLVYRGEKGEVLEGSGLRARGLTLRSAGGEAQRLEAESIQFRTPHGASWQARALLFAETRWLQGGARSAERTESAELRYRDPGGERWRFDGLHLGPASLGSEGEARIESAASQRTAFVSSSGETFQGLGLRSGPAERGPGGTIRLSRVDLKTLTSRALSGLTWRARPVEMESFALLDGGQVDAHRLRSGSVSLRDTQGGRWTATGIDASRLQWHLLSHRLKADPLEVERLKFAAGGGTAWAADTLLAGALDWPRGEAPRIRHASAAALEGSVASGLEWRIEDLQATGDVDSAADFPRIRVLSAGAGNVETTTQRRRFEWFGLRATGLRLADNERIGVDRLVFGDVSLSAEARSGASFTAARVAFSDLESEWGRLAAETVTVEDSVANLGVTETGEWVFPAWPGGDASDGALSVKIGELGNRGHNRVAFIDRSVRPPFEVEIAPYRLRVSGLDTLRPRRAALLELDGTLDAAARLEAHGELWAGEAGLDARARVRLGDLDLDRLSDYARRHLDIVVRQGQGDFEFDIELTGGEIEVAGEMALRDLALEPAPSADAAGESFAGGLVRLSESGEAIDLRISVRGPISDPGFDFAAAAGEAIVRGAGLAPGAGTADGASSSQQQQ